MSEPFNKFRAAIEILQKGRDVLVEALAEEVLSEGEDLAEGGFLFNEFLEAQGTRLHFLGLIVAQLEQSAEMFEENQRAAAPPVYAEQEPEPEPEVEVVPEPEPAKPVVKRRKSRSKKLQQTSAEGRADEA